MTFVINFQKKAHFETSASLGGDIVSLGILATGVVCVKISTEEEDLDPLRKDNFKKEFKILKTLKFQHRNKHVHIN